MKDTTPTNPPVVLYDGSCGFCSFWVQQILKYDTRTKFRFASLQGKFGQDFLHRHNLEAGNFKSIYLLEGANYFSKSQAVVEIANILGGKIKIFKILKLIPKPIADFFYTLVARNRHKIAAGYCILPTPEQRSRFLD